MWCFILHGILQALCLMEITNNQANTVFSHFVFFVSILTICYYMLQSALSIIPLRDSKIWRQQESKDEMSNVYTVSGT